jgi:tetratricopeptide (TPR) repeat protein
MGQVYQAMGEVADARWSFDAARALGEGGAVEEGALQGLADLFLFTEGLSGIDVRNYERMVAIDPTSSAAFWIYDQISQAHQKAATLDGCIAAYERMADLAPYSVGMLARLGVAYAAAGRTNEAAAAYGSAIEGAKEPKELYPQLATLFRRAGRIAEADSLVAKARRDEK